MPDIPVGFAQVTHFFSGAQVPTGAAVTYGVDPAVGATPFDVAGQAASSWVNQILTNQTASIQLTSTLCKFGPNETGPSAISTVGGPGSEAAAEGLAPQVAVLVHKNTDLGGRRGRGRMYVPGYQEEWVLNTGVIVAANLITLQGDYTAWFNELVASASIDGLVLLHSPSAPDVEDPSPVPVPTPITSVVVDAVVATQRRRLRR